MVARTLGGGTIPQVRLLCGHCPPIGCLYRSYPVIDARTQYDPYSAPSLVSRATQAAGSQKELAECCGVTTRYLRMLSRGEKTMSYAVQVMLEQIAVDA